MSTVPAIEITGLRKSFGRTAVIRGVDLSIPAGSRHAIIGPNGAGKSTLFSLISGSLPPDSGVIRLEGRDVTGRSPFELRRLGLSRSFQVTNIFPRLSVYENVRCSVLGGFGHGCSIWKSVEDLEDVRERTVEVLDQIGLTERSALPAGVLTYAEQRALEIGITIAGGAEVILLDEPTAGMSRRETARVMELIRRVSEGKTLVLVEHDMSVVFTLADAISVLVYGEVIATDTPSRIRGNAAVQEAYLGTEEPGCSP